MSHAREGSPSANHLPSRRRLASLAEGLFHVDGRLVEWSEQGGFGKPVVVREVRPEMCKDPAAVALLLHDQERARRLSAGGDGGYAPQVDIAEDKNSVEVTAELPGMSSKDIRVDLAPSRDFITIQGNKEDQRERKDDNYCRTERYFGSIRRDVPLPAPVKDKNIEATFKDGVLTVRLAKTDEADGGARRIEVSSG